MRSKKKELKPGDVIDIKPEHQSIIKSMIEDETGLKHGLAALSEMLKNRHQQTWEAVNSLYPEIADYICTITPEEDIIRVLYKRESVLRKEAREAGKH